MYKNIINLNKECYCWLYNTIKYSFELGNIPEYSVILYNNQENSGITSLIPE